MSVPAPECFLRNCKHFINMIQNPKTDITDANMVVSCTAFPKGAPDDIAYGDNLHLEPVEGDNGIQFEKGLI